MFPVMLLTILFGALVHVHGAFWFGLLPCVGLLAGYAHTALYGMWERDGWIERLYVRVKVIPDEYFVIDRSGTKRVQWVEIGTVTRKGKTGFTFTLACLTFQIGWQPNNEKVFSSETKYYEDKTSRPLTAEESAAIGESMKRVNGFMDDTFAEVGKMFDKLKDNKKS